MTDLTQLHKALSEAESGSREQPKLTPQEWRDWHLQRYGTLLQRMGCENRGLPVSALIAQDGEK